MSAGCLGHEPGYISRICPVCSGADAHPYLDKAQLHLARCSRCAMIYANPVPRELASGEYYDCAGREYYLSPAKLQSDFAPVRFERELRVFRKHCPSGNVLDVGCSTGGFLFQLSHQFPGAYTILGTDASAPALDYAAARGVPILRGDFLELDCSQARFDAVTFWAVLEHLSAPKSFLERAWHVLRPGGFCFVLVPNMESLAVRWLGARYRYIYPQHLNYFTRATLARLGAERFATVAFHSTHFNPLVLWQDWRTRGAEVSNRERGDLLKRTTAYKQSPWLALLKPGYRFVETVLGILALADNLLVVWQKQDG